MCFAGDVRDSWACGYIELTLRCGKVNKTHDEHFVDISWKLTTSPCFDDFRANVWPLREKCIKRNEHQLTDPKNYTSYTCSLCIWCFVCSLLNPLNTSKWQYQWNGCATLCFIVCITFKLYVFVISALISFHFTISPIIIGHESNAKHFALHITLLRKRSFAILFHFDSFTKNFLLLRLLHAKILAVCLCSKTHSHQVGIGCSSVRWPH